MSAAAAASAATTARLRPLVTERGSAGFFSAAAENRIEILTCEDCGRRIHLPRPRCVYCASTEVSWKPAAHTGTVYSHTVVEHQVHPLFPVPYTVIVVDLDGEAAGVRLIGNLPGRAEVTAGTPVRCTFEDLGEDAAGNPVVLPVWEIDTERASAGTGEDE
ncbi:OB-fold domain-containing protein [Rhodococcus sp. HM1]|uniref:Zn-ribbon domain-containing OB-fold protein n=1 Tax=unclassified Rhodococcus (in: high G+C Gram-positive bacteria) TaxID=192944 RepID=UPI0018CCB1F0|nr:MULTISPECIES: OB-fold domain-containing protein [unclassified Rhodococcus (in: high G+C Gram-positive bacteria)]MBH0120323.1 OB-fold domain-containing protein [Rhodococcus sp. CX]MCK8674897.1 OB-fold domain-containing protein [Rhodococcus sp. HM1]